MRELTVEIYKNLRSAFSSEQSIYIVIIELLYRYLECTKCIQDKPLILKQPSQQSDPWLTRDNAKNLISKLEGYDIKEAGLMLIGLIDWPYLDLNIQAKEAVSRTEAQIQHLHITDAELPDIMLQVLEAAGMESPIVTTPESIHILMQHAVRWQHVASMAEFCCGSAGVAGSIARELPDLKQGKIQYYGEDLLPFSSIFAKIMLWATGIQNSTVMVRDSLKYDSQYTIKGQFDLIVADLPMGNNRGLPVQRQDLRMDCIFKKTLFADWIFIEDILYRLSDRGRAFVLTTRGALIRKNEQELREQVLESDWLEAVIALPANLYPHTNLERELIIFNKDKYLKGQVLFLDLSQYSDRASRNQCKITEEGLLQMQHLADISMGFSEGIDSIACVSIKAIRDNGSNWNPYSYLAFQKTAQNVKDGVTLGSIATVTRGAQLSKEEETRLASEDGSYFLNIKNIANGKIHYEDCPRINPKSFSWRSKYQIRENDILIATKGTVIKSALVPPNPPPAFICGNLTIVRVDSEKYHPYVFYEYLQTETGRRYIEALQSGTTIKILNSSNLEKMMVPAYAAELAVRIGEQLKEEQLRYQETITEITERYRECRKNLLNKLEVHSDEENIYQP